MRVSVLILLLSATAYAGTAGNAWHIPAQPDAGVASMRLPTHGIGDATDVQIYSGNQFAGAGGNPGNQLQTGSAVLYRKITDTTWTEAQLTFASQGGNNKYFVATIPHGTAGDTFEYYLRIAYSDHATTFVFGGDGASHTTLDEATAQASPFAYGVEFPLAPAGSSASVGDAKIYTDSGHIALGAVAVAPPMVMLDGELLPIGKVTSQTAIANGLELQQSVGRRTITSHLTTPADGIARYEVIDWGGTAPTQSVIAGAADASEHFYGFGEKFDGLDQRGKVVRVMTADHPGDKGDNSYLVSPWLVSSKGYGFHLDASAESSFDLTAADRFTATLTFSTLAFHLVAGPTPRDVVSHFTSLTGRAPLPPPWVFGPWISSDEWRDGGEVRYVVEKWATEHIPGSVFVFDSPWEVAYNDFAWNMSQFGAGNTYEGTFYSGFASPGDMMQYLKSHGFKVVVWLTPFVNVRSNDEGVPGANLGKAATYDQAAAAGYFVTENNAPLVSTWWKGDGSPVDFTNPAARAWFQQQLQQLVDASGGVIAGFKTDDGESDYIPLDAHYADGRTGVEMKLGYPVEYLKSVYSVLGADGIVFARSGFTGTQATPAIWAGDNEPNFGVTNGLPSVVSAALSASMSGYALWGSDIGGYQDVNPSSSPENLFMRWTQFGALTPIMSMHRQITAGLQYPWSYGQAGLDNFRAFAQLHTQLFPYIYTAAKQASVDGTPLIRPLPFDGVSTVSDEFMFGDDLLVAPVLDKDATGRQVVLPAGTWYDYWTSARYDGGQTIAWTGDPDQLPLFVREGAIVPRISPDVMSLNDAAYVGNPAVITPDGSLDFLIYPTATAHEVVYDGTETTFDGNTISIVSTPRAMTLAIDSTMKPTSITRDGVALAEGTDWSYDGVFIHVSFTHGGGTTVLVLDGVVPPGGGGDGSVATNPEPGKAGCCDAGGAPPPLALGVLVALTLRRRRAYRELL